MLQPTQATWQFPHHGMGDPCSAHCIPSAHCLCQEVLLEGKFSSLASHTPAFPPRGAQQRLSWEDTRGHLSQLWQVTRSPEYLHLLPAVINMEEHSCTKKYFMAQRETLTLKWALLKNCKTTGFEAAVSTQPQHSSSSYLFIIFPSSAPS